VALGIVWLLATVLADNPPLVGKPSDVAMIFIIGVCAIFALGVMMSGSKKAETSGEGAGCGFIAQGLGQ